MQPLEGKQKRLREAPSLVTWKQGVYWVTIVPPFRTKGTKPDVVYSRHKPAHAKVVARGKGSPGKTLYTFGKLPPKIALPMGVVSAKVKHGRKLVFHRQNGKRRVRTK